MSSKNEDERNREASSLRARVEGQAAGDLDATANPYANGSPESVAWSYGRAEAREQVLTLRAANAEVERLKIEMSVALGHAESYRRGDSIDVMRKALEGSES